MTMYRTKTYIAADWSEDENAVDQLRKWNESDYWDLSFTDAHNLTQARDNSLNCSIKASLKKRLDVSKTFVLIVGKQTKNLKSGSCQYCNYYSKNTDSCANGRGVDFRSYIEYECDIAKNDINKIIVLYKSTSIDEDKCPDALVYRGRHRKMIMFKDGKLQWHYQEVKSAFK